MGHLTLSCTHGRILGRKGTEGEIVPTADENLLIVYESLPSLLVAALISSIEHELS